MPYLALLAGIRSMIMRVECGGRFQAGHAFLDVKGAFKKNMEGTAH